MTRATGSEWRNSAALIALSLVPAAAGTVRLAELAQGAEITAANARFFASPLPVLLHVPAVIVYSMLGALQFAPTFGKVTEPGIARLVEWWSCAASSPYCQDCG